MHLLGVSSPGAGMCMDGGTITGDSEFPGRDEPGLDGGKDSHEIKELLEAALKVEWDVFMVEQTLCNPLSNFRLTL